MLVVTARLAVDPERTEEFELLARELWEATHRLEPGCRRYEYVRCPAPGEYLALMAFDDHDAFLVHQASEHHTRIAAGPMRDLVRSIELDLGESVAGASGAPEVSADGPLQVDASLVEYYADRYPPPDFGGWRR